MKFVMSVKELKQNIESWLQYEEEKDSLLPSIGVKIYSRLFVVMVKYEKRKRTNDWLCWMLALGSSNRCVSPCTKKAMCNGKCLLLS